MTMAATKKPNKNEDNNPSGKLSLSLSKPVADFANARADERYEGNVSRYVRILIQRDMKKQKVAA